MTKSKNRSEATQRFKKTASGYKHKHQHKSHILTKMTTKRKRQLRGTSILNAADKPRVDRMLRNV